MRIIRHQRTRKKVSGTKVRPRLSVFRSLNHIYAQIINDEKGVTLASASSLEKSIRTENKTKKELAERIGKEIEPGEATGMMAAQSIAHVVIVIFIIFGNITYFLTRSKKRKGN